jgi:hypothetical protein
MVGVVVKKVRGRVKKVEVRGRARREGDGKPLTRARSMYSLGREERRTSSGFQVA